MLGNAKIIKGLIENMNKKVKVVINTKKWYTKY